MDFSDLYTSTQVSICIAFAIIYFILAALSLAFFIRGIVVGAFLIQGPFADTRSAWITGNYLMICLTSLLKGLILYFSPDGTISVSEHTIMILGCILGLQFWPVSHQGSYLALLMAPNSLVPLSVKHQGNPCSSLSVLLPYCFMVPILIILPLAFLISVYGKEDDPEGHIDWGFPVLVTIVALNCFFGVLFFVVSLAYGIKTLTWWRQGSFKTSKMVQQFVFSAICAIFVLESLLAIGLGNWAKKDPTTSYFKSEQESTLAAFLFFDTVSLVLLSFTIVKTPKKLKHRQSEMRMKNERAEVAATKRKKEKKAETDKVRQLIKRYDDLSRVELATPSAAPFVKSSGSPRANLVTSPKSNYSSSSSSGTSSSSSESGTSSTISSSTSSGISSVSTNSMDSGGTEALLLDSGFGSPVMASSTSNLEQV